MIEQKQTVRIAKPLGVQAVVKGEASQNNSHLRIFSESGCDEGAYYPAQDIQIYGDKQLEDLRDFIAEILKEREEFKKKTQF